MAKLTAKQKAFCMYYIENMGNATQAALKAGYSEKSAYSMGSENLSKPEIKAFIDEIMNQKEAERFMSAEEVLTRLADRAKNAQRDTDKIKSLELLGKFHQLFTDRVNITSNIKYSEFVAEWGKDDVPDAKE